MMVALRIEMAVVKDSLHRLDKFIYMILAIITASFIADMIGRFI